MNRKLEQHLSSYLYITYITNIFTVAYNQFDQVLFCDIFVICDTFLFIDEYKSSTFI